MKLCDVLIIGGGGAGLSASIAAAEAGKTVILLEKNSECGGSTSWSVGSVTTSCSRFQAQQGISDSRDSHFKDMAKFHGRLAGRDNEALRRILTDNLPQTFEHLLSLGLVFFGPTLEPPHSVPRMHNILPHSRAFAHVLAKRAKKLGVSILTGHRAVRLVKSHDRISEVEVEAGGGHFSCIARNGIVLAAGDFSASVELKRQYLGELLAEIDAVNSTSTGDGHRLAIEHGAIVANGDIVTGPQLRFVRPQRNFLTALPPIRMIAVSVSIAKRFLPAKVLRPFLMKFLTTVLEPQRGLFEAGAILVNKRGDRFCDELAKPEMTIPLQPEKQAFIILDGELAYRFNKWPNYISTAPGVAYAYIQDYRKTRRDIFVEAADIDALARALQMDCDKLRTSLKNYNANPRSGTRGLLRSPFIALGPLKSVIPITDGGLRIDSQMRVLSRDGFPLLGLYAAGANGQGGLLLEGHGHHLGWAFTSGRLAGQNAAAFKGVP